MLRYLITHTQVQWVRLRAAQDAGASTLETVIIAAALAAAAIAAALVITNKVLDYQGDIENAG